MQDKSAICPSEAADAAELFAGPGEVRSIARNLDWSQSPLGPTSGWTPALRTMSRSIFESPDPICLWCGPQFALIYNDAYRRILGAKHPAALGTPPRMPLSTSAFFTHSLSVCPEQPIFAAIDTTAAHRDG